MKTALVLLSGLCLSAVSRLSCASTIVHPGQVNAEVSPEDEDLYKIPDGLLIGAGVSACQVEGGWNERGKAESLLDHMVHMPNNPIFNANVNEAADHYHRFREDLAFAQKMKFSSHRFSISWSRVLPKGDTSFINGEAVRFYHDYIDEVKRLGMEPMVTMLHFDQPQALEEETGGWTNRLMVDKYVDYADFLFKEFGSRVKYWTTVNEPNMYCNYFLSVIKILGMPAEDLNIYKCMHHMNLAHMKTYRVYKEKYFKDQGGMVGSSALLWPTVPASTKAEDAVAASTFNDLFAGTVLHPLVYGDYPPIARYVVDSRSKEMGLEESRLPQFTAAEKEQLVGSTDFIALNVYSGYAAEYSLDGSKSDVAPFLGPILEDVPYIKLSGGKDAFNKTDDSLMHNALVWTWNAYHVPIVISENGFADAMNLGLKDAPRSEYHSANLRSLMRTMKKFGVEVIGYYVWSLIDSFEFSSGYDKRPFGLVHVDYKSGSLNRTLKDSASFFTQLNTERRVPYVPPHQEASGSAVLHLSAGLLLPVAAVLAGALPRY